MRTSLAMALEEHVRNENYIYPKRIITSSVIGIPLVCLAVLVVEAMERWGYYGGGAVAGVYQPEMLLFSTASQQLYSNFNTFWSYGTALFGAYLADAYLGKVKTIAIFCVVYVVGVVLQALSAMPFSFGDFPNEPKMAPDFYWAAIFFIGLGTGGIKANVGPLLSEQIPNPNAEKTEMVFRYFYWAINVGALAAYVISPLVHRFDKDKDHPNGTTYYYSFWSTAAAFVVAIVVFYSFIPFYISSRVSGSPIGRFFKCMWSAFRNRSSLSMIDGEEHFVYNAEGFKEKELKDYRRIISVFGLLIHYPIFWYLYGQNSNYVTTMGTFMRRPSWVTADQLGLVDPLAIIIMVPVFDRLILPFLRKVCGFKLNIITRIAIGYFFMALCGVGMMIEMEILKANGHWNEAGNKYHANDTKTQMSVFWTIPLFFLCALGEIFASITLNEFTYSQAPPSLKSVMFGLGTFTNCGSSILGLIISPFTTPYNLPWIWLAFSILCFLQVLVIPYQFRNYQVRDTSEDVEQESEDYSSPQIYHESTVVKENMKKV